MKHLGDITKISGYSAPIVDCIIGGSPCQDLSVAGKRAGLDGERSGLYIEQVRIVKEMRERDVRDGRSGVDVRPRYMVWENVPGAFSSNKGEDFRIVLEELAKVNDENAVIPMPDKGKWTTSGCILGDGWSIAWRVLDAQFWGVPQRRRRIALVADFGGHSAPEILFVRKSVSGDSEPSKQKRKGTSSDAEGSLGADDRFGADQYNAVILGDTVSTLGVNCGMSHGRQCVLEPITFEPGIASREGGHIYEGVCGTLRANAGDNQMAAAYTMQDREGKAGGGKGALIAKELSATLRAGFAQTLFQPITFSKSKRAQSDTDFETWKESDIANTLNGFDVGDVRTSEAVVYSVENHPADSRVDIDESGKVQTLTSRMGTGGGNVPMVLALDRASFNQGKNAQYDFEISDKGVNSPLVAKGPGAVCYSVDQGGGKSSVDIREDQAPTLTTTHHGAPAVCYSFDPTSSRDAGDYILEGVANPLINGTCPGHKSAVCYWDGSQTVGTLTANNAGGNQRMPDKENFNCVITSETRYIVRRLTPNECERLQGYPDGWTDIGDYIDSQGKKKTSSDAARYKALGNSIALPPWKWVLKRLCACYERDATMASLFDGIGGFPLLWEQINGKGSCLWASEIEEFPIAVTKARIGE